MGTLHPSPPQVPFLMASMVSQNCLVTNGLEVNMLPAARLPTLRSWVRLSLWANLQNAGYQGNLLNSRITRFRIHFMKTQFTTTLLKLMTLKGISQHRQPAHDLSSTHLSIDIYVVFCKYIKGHYWGMGLIKAGTMPR